MQALKHIVTNNIEHLLSLDDKVTYDLWFKKADDAVVVDTSELDFEESVLAIKAVIAEKDGQ